MQLDYFPEERALRDELQVYFAELIGDRPWHVPHGETREPDDREVIRQLGRDGWLGRCLPPEYGGGGRPLFEQYILFDEAQRAGVPISHMTVMTVAPALVKFGTDVQKQELLPRIMRGEIVFAIGYSEPSAGTDLAQLRTRARRTEDGYVINGQKYFTSGADTADYVWLAARTGAPDSRHRGISIFLVPTDHPGFRYESVPTLAAHRTNVTYYDDVELPGSARVGDENQGWQLITSQLNLERITLVMPGAIERILGEVRDYALQPDASGGRLIDQPWVRLHLAKVTAMLDALRLLTQRFAWQTSAGMAPDQGGAAAVKVFGSEAAVEIYALLLEVLGEAGYLRRGSPGAALHGVLEEAYRAATIKTFGGGVNEVQRDMIAQSALGLPRVPRRPAPTAPTAPGAPTVGATA